MPSTVAKSAPTAVVHTGGQGYVKRAASILQNLALKAIAPGNVPLAGRASKTHALSSLLSTRDKDLTVNGLLGC